MAQFPTAAHLVSWAKLSPQTIQSGPKTRSGKTGKGNRYLKSVLGEAAISAARLQPAKAPPHTPKQTRPHLATTRVIFRSVPMSLAVTSC